MKKNLKILICMALCFGLLISNNSVIFAASNKSTDLTEATIISNDLKKYSKDTSIPLSELEERH